MNLSEKSHTMFELTKKGRTAFDKYREEMKKALDIILK